jgi:uncharacterized protein with PIN domain
LRFWDSSAPLPLLVDEPTGAQLRCMLAEDPQMLAWWSSRAEMASALARRERDGLLSAAVVAASGEPATLEFACLDEGLSAAARREGFPILLAAAE